MICITPEDRKILNLSSPDADHRIRMLYQDLTYAIQVLGAMQQPPPCTAEPEIWSEHSEFCKNSELDLERFVQKIRYAFLGSPALDLCNAEES